MNDLISRRAAIDTIVSLTAFESEDELEKFVEEKACDDYYLGGLYDAIDEIKDITAVDAVPVVHARWLYEHGDPAMLPCSACGYEVYRYNNTPYCPCCGARMDGERRDGE